MNQDDYDFLSHHNLHAHDILSRDEGDKKSDALLKVEKLTKFRWENPALGNRRWIMFDDSIPVLRHVSAIGITTYNATIVNEKLRRSIN